ncbi:hypothetical protein Tco_1297732, partial [Tanacetum coccineum]
SEHAGSSSLDAELALTDSETKLDEEVPGKQDEGQTRSNPGDAAESQPQPSHVVYAILDQTLNTWMLRPLML